MTALAAGARMTETTQSQKARRLLALALALAAVVAPHPTRAAPPADAVSRAEWTRQDALRPQRAAKAARALQAQRAALGLAAADAFVAAGSFTNDQGRAIVRLEQRHLGHRVWGAQAVVHVLPDGTVRTRTGGVERGISLAGGPTITAARARELALARLGPVDALRGVPEVEQVVFPARHTGGLATRLDPVTGLPVVDRRLTVTARLAADHVWAWEVRTGVQRTAEGVRDVIYVVDGRTGEILNARDMLQHFTPVPVKGTGRGYYSGVVELDTSRMADGSYALYDTTRGILPCPDLVSITPDDSGWSPTGMQTWYEGHDTSGVSDYSYWLYGDNPVNSWGDGFHFNRSTFGREWNTNGQTAAVDAQYGMATTWDFYDRVFGRNGPDGQGTSISALVLSNGFTDADNAYWSIGGKSAYLGVGTYPWNPLGLHTLTDLDVIAHEVTHGVTSPSYAQSLVNSPGSEEAGISEGTSDFFSTMVRLWAAGPRGSDIPEGDAEWFIGMNFGHGTPLRWSDLPSEDGRSVDGWFDGMALMDGHFSSGPVNRALYFLAHGASATAGARDHSVYLPIAFPGVGNDAAARIWFKTVTEFLIPDGTGKLTLADGRAAALEAAADLYGEGSPFVTAVENAFGAVNVGDGHGQPPHVKVWFKPWRDDWIHEEFRGGHDAHQFFPKGETVRMRVTVENTTDTRVTWRTGGPSMFNGAIYWVDQGGVIHDDGSWTTPNDMGWYSVTGTSVADPRQFAEGRVFLISMDTDQDHEQDATDMAGIAFSWYLGDAINPAHSVYLAPAVDNQDVGLFVDAMKNAWPVK